MTKGALPFRRGLLHVVLGSHAGFFQSTVQLVHGGDVGRVLAAFDAANGFLPDAGSRRQFRLGPAGRGPAAGNLLGEECPQGFCRRLVPAGIGVR
jgi:hypothetical protein